MFAALMAKIDIEGINSVGVLFFNDPVWAPVGFYLGTNPFLPCLSAYHARVLSDSGSRTKDEISSRWPAPPAH